jgi:hypothetical protein
VESSFRKGAGGGHAGYAGSDDRDGFGCS